MQKGLKEVSEAERSDVFSRLLIDISVTALRILVMCIVYFLDFLGL